MTAVVSKHLEGLQGKAAILIEALPYIRRLAGKTVVIKVGGEIVDDADRANSLAEDLLLMQRVGIRVILCHGGGPQINRLMEHNNKEAEFVDGLRVTDADTLELTAMALLGVVNRSLVALLNQQDNHSIGLSGVDGGLFRVSAGDPELGFVGKIDEVYPRVVLDLIDQGYIPVIAPLGLDAQSQTYNINADTAAAALAGALGAEKLIVLTNVAGLYESIEDANSFISEIDATKLEALLDSGILRQGIVPKARAVLEAVEAGVSCAHILDGRLRHAVLLEIFTSEGVGTMVTL
jgi:acetylglutamate kinase